MLNLTGFFNPKWKVIGEDLTEGKLTAPVVLALRRMPDQASREQLWKRVAAKPQAAEEVRSIIEVLKDCGAIAEANAMAHKMVEDAWAKICDLVPASYYTVMLRAFARCILTRVS